MKSFLIKLVWRFCSWWLVPRFLDICIFSYCINQIYFQNDLGSLWVEGPEYTVLPLRVRVGVVLLALGVSPPRPLPHLGRPPALGVLDGRETEMSSDSDSWTHPRPSGCAGVWVGQFVFVVIRHPHCLLPSYCVPAQSAPSTRWHRLEVRSGVRRDVRCRLGYFFHLELFCHSFSVLGLNWVMWR